MTRSAAIFTERVEVIRIRTQLVAALDHPPDLPHFQIPVSCVCNQSGEVLSLVLRQPSPGRSISEVGNSLTKRLKLKQ